MELKRFESYGYSSVVAQMTGSNICMNTYLNAVSTIEQNKIPSDRAARMGQVTNTPNAM